MGSQPGILSNKERQASRRQTAVGWPPVSPHENRNKAQLLNTWLLPRNFAIATLFSSWICNLSGHENVNMSASEPVKQASSLDTTNGLPHTNELKTLQENLGSGYKRDDSHELNTNCGSSVQMPPLNPSQPNSSGVTGSAHVNFGVKIEPSDAGQKNIGEPLRFDVNSAERTPADGLVTEEPLEIQCGENAALLYVSKLCQGSKGPCILFQGEWLTPNELQYISGRETAKDWKRSIRYKGKSLKSLIARGLIKVHPPICDCLGCRISSPVVRN